jgi:Flp pilus assembly protein TadB
VSRRLSTKELGSLRNRGWSRLEAAIWFFGLAFILIAVILVIIEVAGNWLLLVAGVIPVAIGLMRYRAEAEQKKRSADSGRAGG